MQIPVFHDDQHGTGIISAAALINGLQGVNKRIEAVRLVCPGAGAAAIACLDLMVQLGVRPEPVKGVDSRGLIWKRPVPSIHLPRRPETSGQAPAVAARTQRSRP